MDRNPSSAFDEIGGCQVGLGLPLVWRGHAEGWVCELPRPYPSPSSPFPELLSPEVASSSSSALNRAASLTEVSRAGVWWKGGFTQASLGGSAVREGG